jgi:aminoglycoside phosphotransferase (APT) family kinase protein
LSPADVAALLGGGDVRDLARMLGGASRETWSFTYDGRELVLRRDPPGSPRAGGLAREAALINEARAAGVPVPEIIEAAPGHVVMTRLHGETLARRILRDDDYAAARAVLVRQCATALARLHTRVPVEATHGLPRDPDPVASLRNMLDDNGDPYPAFELALARLDRTRPPQRDECVVHGDFRLGNLMVGASGLAGVLDWELAHAGNPVEDLGWLCVRSWRFGGSGPVAGVGTRDELLTAYAEAGGSAPSLDELAWWELYGTVRWGIICRQQAALHLTRAVRSIELAAIGRRTAEVELDALELLAPDVVARTLAQPDSPEPVTTSGLTDRPTATELIEAVAEWIGGLALDGRQAFEAKVAGRILATLQREFTLGPALAAAHERRLAGLGAADDASLAAQIRHGRDGTDLVEALVTAAIDKLRVADPRQLKR